MGDIFGGQENAVAVPNEVEGVFAGFGQIRKQPSKTCLKPAW